MAFFHQTWDLKVFRFFPELKYYQDTHANQCPFHVFPVVVTLNGSVRRKMAKMDRNSEGTREHQNWALVFQRLSNFKLYKNAPKISSLRSLGRTQELD